MIAISGPVRVAFEGESGQISDRPPRKRSPGTDAAAGEHVRANFSLHRRAGYERSQKRPTMIFRGGKRDIRSHLDAERRNAGPPTTRAGGHTAGSWNRPFQKLCVPLGN